MGPAFLTVKPVPSYLNSSAGASFSRKRAAVALLNGFYVDESQPHNYATEKVEQPMNGGIDIRMATVADAEAIRAIYAPYVTDSAITFEYDVPSVEEMARRIRTVQERHVWLVATDTEGAIAGYAYASPFKERAAYQWAVETSIYVRRDVKRRGIGKLLHDALEKAMKAQGILNMNACISYPASDPTPQASGLRPQTSDSRPDAPDLTLDSVRFHERMGYTRVAHFHLCGRKFGRWYDMIWMEKHIGEHV
jgi:phosphinothricin acetyltransferase